MSVTKNSKVCVISKGLYFNSCQQVIRSFFEFSKQDLKFQIMSRDKRLSERTVGYLVQDFTSDLDVSVEVLRCIICSTLGLEFKCGYVAFRVLVELGTKYMQSKLEFASNLSHSEKQGVLQICMHMIVSAKEEALGNKEV